MISGVQSPVESENAKAAILEQTDINVEIEMMDDSKIMRELAERKKQSASIDINQDYAQINPFAGNGPQSMQTAPTIEPTYDEHGSFTLTNSQSKQILAPYRVLNGLGVISI